MKINEQDIHNFRNSLTCSSDIKLTNLFIYQEDHSFEWNLSHHHPDTPKQVFSITKTISSLAIGIAIDLKLLHLDDKLYSLLGFDNNINNIKVRDILTMTPGIEKDEYDRIMNSKNWTKEFLSQKFTHSPGSNYLYSSHCSHIISAIIMAVSGMDLKVFIEKYLFTPLNISKFRWDKSPEGLTCAGMGLSLSLNDLKKIAHLIFHDGLFYGKRIISTKYIRQAVSPIVRKPKNKFKPLSDKYYGFQFHVTNKFIFRADGAFGQMMYFNKKHGFYLVMQSTGLKIENILEKINLYFSGHDKKEKIKGANYYIENSFKQSSTINKPKFLEKKSYKLRPNKFNIMEIRYVDFNTFFQIKFKYFHNKELVFNLSLLNNCCGEAYFPLDISLDYQKYISKILFSDRDKIVFQIEFLETPYILTIEHTIVNNLSIFKIHQNVGFALFEGILYEYL